MVRLKFSNFKNGEKGCNRGSSVLGIEDFYKSLTILIIFFNTSNFGILKMMERNLGISNRDVNKN